MSYADFDYYKHSFLGGLITSDDFPRLISRASERIDYFTQNRARDFFLHEPDTIKHAACAVAEIIAQAERGNSLANSPDNAQIRFEILGEQHVAYVEPINTASVQGQKALGLLIADALSLYLANSGILSREVYYARR